MPKNQKVLSMDDFKKKLLKIGYLIPKEKEKEYAQKNDVSFKRLENGTSVLLVQRIATDERYSTLYITIQSGSYFDPPGKRGAHHFLEHLFFTGRLGKVLAKHSIEYNAYTSQTRVSVYNAGVYNEKYVDIGLLQGLPKTLASLHTPVGLASKKTFQYEKNVILREVSEHNGNHKALTYDLLYETLLAPENPFALNALGTEESVAAVTMEDIQEILKERVVSRNFIVSSLSSGDGGEAQSLAKYLEQTLEKFPRKGKKADIDLNLYSKLKPLLSSYTRLKIPITNKIIALFNVRVIDIEAYSDSSASFLFLMQHLRNVFFSEARNQGLGYTVDLFSNHFLPNKMVFGAFLVVPSQDEEKSSRALTKLLDKILLETEKDEKELKVLLSIEKDRQMASPISQRSILDNCLSSLQDFDLLSDTKVGREIYASLSVSLLKKTICLIKSTKPSTIVIGDLN